MTKGIQQEMFLVTDRSQVQARQLGDLKKITWYAGQLLMVKKIQLLLYKKNYNYYSIKDILF